MSLLIKICGLNTSEALDAALEAGADLVGFVFFAPSPRHVGLSAARALGERGPVSYDPKETAPRTSRSRANVGRGPGAGGCAGGNPLLSAGRRGTECRTACR